jgi:hypothetical protein
LKEKIKAKKDALADTTRTPSYFLLQLSWL